APVAPVARAPHEPRLLQLFEEPGHPCGMLSDVLRQLVLRRPTAALQGAEHLEREHRLAALAQPPVGLGDEAPADASDAAGDLLPLLQAEVGAKTLGYLDAVLVDRGDPIRKGQLLALVRPSDLPDQLSAARSTAVQADAAGALARANLDRARALAPAGRVSK